MNEDLEILARKWALVNALKHEGQADVGAVMGKIFAERPELRTQARLVVEVAKSVVSTVNRMELDQIRETLRRDFGESLIEGRGKEIERPNLPPLPGADKFEKVVTRFAPNPDFVLHLGSARPIILSHDYARMYNGKFMVRFEDTDPRLKKSILEYYDLIIQDIEWLNCKPDEIRYQSDRLQEYYKVATQLLNRRGAYVCTHKPDGFKELVLAKKACNCRRLPASKHLERWEEMLAGQYAEGEAVVRIVTDLGHPNPAVREWPALRIIDPQKYPHPRVGSKYRVWPLYNFAAGCDDHLMGITHIIRGKEHYTNMVRQKYMYSHMGWDYPVAIHHGRMGIEGVILSKSRILKGVKEGRFNGMDDPRIGTIRAVQRRGFVPEAIRQIIYEVNVRPSEARISWEKLCSYQRKMVDSVAPRYFLIQNPVRVEVRTSETEIWVQLAKHPSNPQAGERKLRLSARKGKFQIFIERGDAQRSVGKNVRLMGAMNIKVLGKAKSHLTAREVPGGVEEIKKVGGAFIHWLPQDQTVRCRLVRPEGNGEAALAEPELRAEPVNRVVQLERVGFARIDSKDPVLTLYFTCR